MRMLLCLVLPGCMASMQGGGDAPGGTHGAPQGDTDSPGGDEGTLPSVEIVASNPAHEEMDVGVGVKPQLTLSAWPEGGPSVSLFAGDNRDPVVIGVLLDEAELRITVVPSQDLRPGLPYTLRVDPGAREVSFRTAKVVWPGGGFMLLGGDQPVRESSAFFQSANIDAMAGIAVRVSWATHEIADGVYDWSYVDDAVDAALAHGKVVSLAVFSELGSAHPFPQWLTPTSFFYSIDLNPNHATYGQCRRYIAPWDPFVRQRWLRYLSALGQHIAAHPTRRDAIVYINGAGDAATYNWGYGQPLVHAYLDDACTQEIAWESLLSADDLIALLIEDLQAFMTAFPRHPQWFSVGHTPLESCGGKTCVAEALAAYGFARYPDRFGLWREDLNGKRASKTPPVGDLWTLLSRHRPKVGAQMVWSVQDCPATCRMGGAGTAKADALAVAMEIGGSSNTAAGDGYYLMPYQEIYAADVADASLASVFADAIASDVFTADSTAPLVPEPLTAVVSPPGVELGWPAVADIWDKTSAAAMALSPEPVLSSLGTVSYEVLRDGQVFATVASPGFTDPAGAGHSYTVRAVDAAGNASEESNAVQGLCFFGPTFNCSALQVSGEPAAMAGASWTYASVDDGVTYDLTGVLLKPDGPGVFPAVLVSHGKGGAASGYARNIGQHLRDAGAVVIATNYTHSAVPGGSPMGDVGASVPNLQRAAKARQLLACLAYVDDARVAAHGHSQGAFITAQLAGLQPASFVVASHTAGGVSDTGFVNDDVPTTTAAVAAQIDVPYLVHHGDDDDVVPLALDQRFDDILETKGTTHHLETRAGFTHQAIALDATMIDAVITWYSTHGLLP